MNIKFKDLKADVQVEDIAKQIINNTLPLKWKKN